MGSRFILAAVVVFLIVLTIFTFWALSPITGMQQEQQEPGGQQDQPGEQEDGGGFSIPIIIQGSVTIEDQPDSQQRINEARDEAYRLANFRFQVGTFALIAIAAFLSLGAFLNTKKEAKTAEEQLALARRPKLIVRNIVIPKLVDMVEMYVKPTPKKTPAHLLTINYFTVSNIGGSEATITTINCALYSTDFKRLPMRRPYDERSYEGEYAHHFRPGQSIKIPINKRALVGDDYWGKPAHGQEMYFMGMIRYVDQQGIVRETAFCRHWDL